MANGWHRLARPIVAFLGVAACGPEDRDFAEHDEVCGEPSPFRILETDPDRTLASVTQVGHADGRRTVRLGYRDEDSEDSALPVGPTIEQYELWSVGSCGESPRQIETDPSAFRTLDHWPGITFECDRETGDLEAVDLDGERPRNLVFSTNDCDFRETTWGLVEIVPHDDDLGSLVLLPYPEDPWTESSSPQTLVDPIRIRAMPSHESPSEHEVLAIFDDEVFAITDADELVRLSLLDGSTTTEATNVREMEVSSDRAWLIWQDATPTPDGRLLVGDAFNQGSFALVDPVDGTATAIFDSFAGVRLVEDGFEFHEGVYCCIEGDGRSQGPLWSVGFDGARELIAHAATQGYRYLADGRLLTTLDIDEDWRGDLIVVDDALAERIVDENVLASSPGIDEDDTLVYGVVDGERAGVWLARLAP